MASFTIRKAMTPKSSIPEIQITYSNPNNHSERIKIDCAEKLKYVLEDVREPDLIEYRESFYLLLLDNSLNAIGYRQMAVGGISATYVDVRQILAIALKSNATWIVVAHNHPSWNKNPSAADKILTKKIKEACEILEIKLLDHLILTPHGEHYSFAEEGKLY